MIFNFYIFNRKGACLYYKEWNRPLNTLAHDAEEDKRLMFGMLFSLKEVVTKMSSVTSSEGLHCMRTSAYNLHLFHTRSGLRFVLNTSGGTNAQELRAALRSIYADIFVECVVKHPLYRPLQGGPVTSKLFEQRLEDYLRTLPCFSSPP
mmetsp:Transcript_13791/g.20313  ORF Transcript_13791/g.20313 Transcript_13791/m.20313 type:complete len:149 (-) Transcript_13791:467-913(-)